MKEKRLRIAMWLNVAIVGVQIMFGIVAHSLGLIADAGHNLTDFAAVLASMIAIRFARQPATRHRSFGLHRATVLAAQANAASILVITALVSYEAIHRIIHPTRVNGPIVIAVALGAAAANLAAALVLRDPHDHGHGHELKAAHGPAHAHGQAEDLNMRSAMLHMAGDAVASLGVAAAGVVITLTEGWYWLDPAVSIALGLLIARSALRLLRKTLDVLLESTPDGLDTAALSATLSAVEGVEEVHDLHVWALASDVRAMSAHIVVSGHPSLEQAQAIGYAAKASVSEKFI